MRTTNRTYFESARIISNAAKAGDFVEKIDKSIIPKEEFSKFDDSTIERLHTSLVQDSKAVSYFAGRGITKKAIKFFKLGYSDKQDMVTVPVYSHTGVCVGFVARSVEGKAFKNSTGLPRSKVLFNLNNCKFVDIVVVESSFDAIRLWQLDIPAVATLGANVGTVQLALLNKYANTIIVAPDGDEAGSEMVSKLVKGLGGKDIRVLKIPEGKKDIGDMTDEEINHAYSQIKALDLALNI
jgi:DNA primase